MYTFETIGQSGLYSYHLAKNPLYHDAINAQLIMRSSASAHVQRKKSQDKSEEDGEAKTPNTASSTPTSKDASKPEDTAKIPTKERSRDASSKYVVKQQPQPPMPNFQKEGDLDLL